LGIVLSTPGFQSEKYIIPNSRQVDCDIYFHALTYESADVHDTVTFPTTGLPACHGIRVMASGCLPSVRDRPVGSLMTGMPAEVKALATTSFKADVVGLCPGHACRQSHKGHGHQRGTQRSRPRRNPTAILPASSSSFRPQNVMEKASNHSPL